MNCKKTIKEILKKTFINIKKLSAIQKIVIVTASVLIVFFTGLCLRYYYFISEKEAVSLTYEQESYLENFLDDKYSTQRAVIKPLPYKTIPANLDINAESAILIDFNTGNILYEKNDKQIIPPASMIKTFLMYMIFKKVEQGSVSLDDIVPIQEKHYACNMPPRSSLMFLGKGHKVTLKELMAGICVSSGNDASHAIADYIFGSNEQYIQELNVEFQELGLTDTHIVEPSGYSENNVTTAFDMVKFARIYIQKFPEALEFHSLKKNKYPQKHNLPQDQQNLEQQNLWNGLTEYIWTPVTLHNTNGLLNILEGCDGIKTGHITECGFNLMLTCKRGNDRFISVQMKGPGTTMRDGDELRKKDGIKLMEFAFKTFTNYKPFSSPYKKFTRVLFSQGNSVNLIPAWDCSVSLPKINSNTGVALEVQMKIQVPLVITGPVEAGFEYGKLIFILNGFIIQEVPLVADRSLRKSNPLIRTYDYIINKFKYD